MNALSVSANRLYYLDWLRVIAIIGVFCFHNARFYDQFSDWHIKNATTNVGASVLVAFMNPWMMPLFFLISGAGTYFALRNRSVGQFIRERALRILVPLVFGMLVIVVPQAYYQALFRGELPGGYNFFQIYSLYLKTLPDLTFFHLWFLAYLFVFSIAAAPIFVGWGKDGKSVVSRVAAAFDRPWALVLLLVLPLAAADSFLYPGGFWGNRNATGGWSVVAYVQFFVLGYLIFANPRIIEWIKKIGWYALAGAAVTAAALLMVFFDQLVDPTAYHGSAIYLGAMTVEAVNTWCFLLAILSLAGRFLDRSNGFLSYANEAVLPFYVLHQTAIIAIGYYIVPTGMPVIAKYPIVALASFGAIMAIYELVRRVRVLRFLFGMRVNNRQRESTPAVVGAR